MPMSKPEIRAADLDDARAISRLVTQLGYTTSPDEMVARLSGILQHPDYLTFVAETNDEVVGVIGAGVGRYYEKDGWYGRILVIAVGEKYRGAGVGKSLVEEAEQQLKARGIRSIVVNSGSQRSEAHRFYERLGFEETGVRFVKSLS